MSDKKFGRGMKKVERYLSIEYNIPVEYLPQPGNYYYTEEESIQIDSTQTLEDQLYTLLHEAGHALTRDTREWPPRHDRKLYRYRYRVDVVHEEIMAWELGWELAIKLGLKLDYKKYNKVRVKCLFEYIRWANNPSEYEGV